MKNEVKILEKIDWTILNDYVEKNLIVINKHPDYDIWILNYSPRTQIKRVWDIYTLSCRGLVIDIDGNILARPFQKFKNYEEHDPSEIDMKQDYEIFEKMDGSLIILFYYSAAMRWLVASRGSFISEQAVEAQKMLDLKLNISYKLYTECTYLLECLYPENRIVVSYGDLRDLVLLAVIYTETGIEIPHDVINNRYSEIFTIVKKYQIPKVSNLLELKNLEFENKEGFVIRFTNGFRVKVKFEEYIRLHRILTNVSTKTIWEHLSSGLSLDDLLDKVPDEFYNWLNLVVKGLETNFSITEKAALNEFIRIFHYLGITDRRGFAEEARKSVYRAILFKIYDKRPYNDIIWGMIKPDFQKPFKDGYDYVV